MRLKKAILNVMGRDLLKEAVQGLEIDDVDRRSVQKMNARLSRARRATPEYLLELLSEQDVKHVCELLNIDATGRRRTVVPRLLAAGSSPGRKQVATDPPEPSSKVIPSRNDSPQVVAVPRRDSGKVPSHTLYTVGYGGLPEPEEMTALLREHGVEVLVDIRVRPFGRKVLFNKKKLEATYGPVKSAGLDYLHIVELGNEGKGTGVIRLKDAAKGLALLSDEVKNRVVAIMCVCREPAQCHRSVVARKMAKRMPGLRIEHLRALSQT
ncbi:MAG: DUF488 domain-containing protein [Acidobacteria bacterium]|nr:DUF488 domain-containing protein [Acidobacteriota bacterium]